MNKLVVWRLDWDAMLGVNRAVWLATQAIDNDAVRPSPVGQMTKLFVYEPLSCQQMECDAIGPVSNYTSLSESATVERRQAENDSGRALPRIE